MSQVNVLGSYFSGKTSYGKIFYDATKKIAYQYVNRCGLLAVNLTNPLSPYTESFIQISGSTSGGASGGLAVSPDFKTAILINEDYNYNFGAFDISNPAVPIQLFALTYGEPSAGIPPVFVTNTSFMHFQPTSGGVCYARLLKITGQLISSSALGQLQLFGCLGRDSFGYIYLLGRDTVHYRTAIYKLQINGTAVTIVNTFDTGYVESSHQDATFTDDGKYIIIVVDTRFIRIDLNFNVIVPATIIGTGTILTDYKCSYMAMSSPYRYLLFPMNNGKLYIFDTIANPGSPIQQLPVCDLAITLNADGSFFGSTGSSNFFQYGLLFNPASVNNGLNPSQTGAIKLLNMHRPVSLLGNYKS